MLGDNIRFLRKATRISQQELSSAMGIPRTTLGDYERGKTEPNVAKLIEFAKYFDVRVDDLLRIPLQFNEKKSGEHQLKILAISVDNENNGNIELVQSKASAGYLESFQDPEFVSQLPRIHIPNMPEGMYRAFEIEGESMLPMQSGSIVVCRYVEAISEIKDGSTYVLISKEEGLVYKRVKLNQSKHEMILFSDNHTYLPSSLHYSQVSEIWKYQAHIGFSDDKAEATSAFEVALTDIQQSIKNIEYKLST